MPLDVKVAVAKAREYLSAVLGVAPDILLLEEVELTDDDKFWLVTFSFPGRVATSLQEVLGGSRSYKTVKVDAETGQPRSIKIAKV